ncbi:hypothetical protein M9458_007537, partial [Cirrhinus mrigala]
SIAISVQDTSDDTLSYRRIVLLGKSGAGKSSAGNTILGQEVFISTPDSKSVTSECSEKHLTVSGRKISVIDTPALFDTEMSPEEVMKEIMKSVYLSSPGPHAFLIVFKVNMRITEQEEKIPQTIEMFFGQEVLKYSIILFTHGDQLKGKSMEQAIRENSRLKHLVDQCGGRYQVFNNKDQTNRKQVSDLEQKSNTMIEHNGGGHYSNQMFEDAWRFRKEERKKRLMEERRQREEEKRRIEKERWREKERRREEEKRRIEEEKRREEERKKAKNSKWKFFMVGAFVGAVAAAPVGAVLAGVSAVVGAVIGGGAGAVAAAAADDQRRQREEEERRKQEVQRRQREEEERRKQDENEENQHFRE